MSFCARHKTSSLVCLPIHQSCQIALRLGVPKHFGPAIPHLGGKRVAFGLVATQGGKNRRIIRHAQPEGTPGVAGESCALEQLARLRDLAFPDWIL